MMDVKASDASAKLMIKLSMANELMPEFIGH
jgi:hypothetical protein